MRQTDRTGIFSRCSADSVLRTETERESRSKRVSRCRRPGVLDDFPVPVVGNINRAAIRIDRYPLVHTIREIDGGNGRIRVNPRCPGADRTIDFQVRRYAGCRIDTHVDITVVVHIKAIDAIAARLLTGIRSHNGNGVFGVLEHQHIVIGIVVGDIDQAVGTRFDRPGIEECHLIKPAVCPDFIQPEGYAAEPYPYVYFLPSRESALT